MPIDLDRIAFDRSTGIPLWRQLSNQLRDLIADLPAGDVLQGEEPIAETVGVARNVARQALIALADEGLIIRRHGSATTVAPRHVPTVKRSGLCLATLIEKTPGNGPGVLRHVCHLKAGHDPETEPHLCAAGDISWTPKDETHL